MSFKRTAWNNTTGIQAERIAELKNLSREEWLAIRMTGVGGSDISAIAGVNPWASAIDVYLDKTGKKPPIEENEKMKWGKILEQPVADEYANRENVQVNRVRAILRHPKKEHCLANLDRLIIKNGHSLESGSEAHKFLKTKGNGVLEVKTTGWGQAWGGGEIPDMYYLQLQWYLFITGLAWGQFAVLISGQDFLTTDVVEADKKVGENLCEIAERFWRDNVMGDRVPEVDQSPAAVDAMKILYPNFEELTITLDESLNKFIKERLALNEALKKGKSQKAYIDAVILGKMQNAKWGITSEYKVTRVNKNAAKFDAKRFKEENPETHSKYLKESSSIYPLYKVIKK